MYGAKFQLSVPPEAGGQKLPHPTPPHTESKWSIIKLLKILHPGPVFDQIIDLKKSSFLTVHIFQKDSTIKTRKWNLDIMSLFLFSKTRSFLKNKFQTIYNLWKYLQFLKILNFDELIQLD